MRDFEIRKASESVADGLGWGAKGYWRIVSQIYKILCQTSFAENSSCLDHAFPKIEDSEPIS